MSILLEKQRKDANVRPGDTMHNLTVTLMKNGTTQRRIVWNDRNLTTFRLQRNEHIVIEQRIENATAVDIRLYIRLTARVLPYPDAPRSTASQRYVVRRIDFLCASIPLSNCSVLASIAAQFSSYQKMKELEQNSELKASLSEPVLVDARCCNGSVMYYSRHCDSNNCTSPGQWLPVDGAQNSSVCSSAQTTDFVTLQIGADSVINLGLKNKETQLVLLDLSRQDDMTSIPASCELSSRNSDNINSIVLWIVLPLAFTVLLVLTIVLYYKCRRQDSGHRRRQEESDHDNSHNEQVYFRTSPV
ncbi:hypothetical protein BOX15_Mlig017451g2 [Macrostomum lignano]|uniref:Uncharacterized protein n=1 Tax=Macrostomum lignano TaxID=282301 RepID=A0A267EPX8_9PLAT|nr:hypothetical protein BOX15_Mlig017451g2 [Macrostomum lignano]